MGCQKRNENARPKKFNRMEDRLMTQYIKQVRKATKNNSESDLISRFFCYITDIRSVGSARNFSAKYLKMLCRVFAAAFLVILFGAFSSEAQAGNWYVRPSGGSGSGTSWTAAWNGFSGINWGSVSAGDTIWVAGGSYGHLTPGKGGTSDANRITIARARSDSSQCTSAAGWSSSYDSTITQTLSGITFPSYNYITVTGRTTASGGSIGWLINWPSVSSGTGIDWPNGSTGSYINVEYIEIRGPNTTNISYPFRGDGRGIDDTPFTSATNHTFSHMKIWGWESLIYFAGMSNWVVEYSELFYCTSDGVQHPNIIYILGADHGVIRYSRFHDNNAFGTGIPFSDSSDGYNDFKVYGNIFYDYTDENAPLFGIQDGVVTNWLFYNNTLVNTGYFVNISGGGGIGSGCIFRNNLSYNAASVNYGTYSNNSVVGSNPFVNLSGKNFHLSSATSNGYTLSSPYNVDIDGVIRGGDGNWDLGAYEYGSGALGGSPLSPKGLEIQN
jgi:hypothetical protein